MNSDRYNSPHWTESDLISRLYGLDPEQGRSAAHLEECRECGALWLSVQARRGSVVNVAPVPDEALEERLRAQRQAVWARIEKPRRPFLWRMLPAAATALMIFAGVAMHQVKPPVPPVQTASTVSDAQFFNEIASVVNQETPRAADPLQGLFDSNAAPAAIEAQ
ncbi:hypothetical protein [Paludibaculum fermentans]|uniref:hypothetical protein n=1 Tax=Paludibaculum fermentans TaxID=1473598 RepID=UPI003EBAC286